jgi:hypothetical protein
MNQHQIEKIILTSINFKQKHMQTQDRTLQNKRSKGIFNQMRYRREPQKTLPTLVPLVMSFDCKKVEKIIQNKQNQLEEREQTIKFINLSRKSMLIIQIEKEVYFTEIKKLEKLLMLSKGHCFYEGNNYLKENLKLKKGFTIFNTDAF